MVFSTDIYDLGRKYKIIDGLKLRIVKKNDRGIDIDEDKKINQILMFRPFK